MGFWNHRTQSNYSVLVYLTRTLFTCSMNFTLQAGHRHSQQQNLSHSSSTFLLYSTLYHLSQPGQVMFLAKSQWKHLRACTVEVEKIKTAVTNPNIFTNNHSLVSKSASWFDVLLFQIITNSLLSHCPSHHRVLGDTCFPENTELWSLFSPECHRRCATTDWLRITLAGAGPHLPPLLPPIAVKAIIPSLCLKQALDYKLAMLWAVIIGYIRIDINQTAEILTKLT